MGCSHAKSVASKDQSAQLAKSAEPILLGAEEQQGKTSPDAETSQHATTDANKDAPLAETLQTAADCDQVPDVKNEEAELLQVSASIDGQLSKEIAVECISPEVIPVSSAVKEVEQEELTAENQVVSVHPGPASSRPYSSASFFSCCAAGNASV